MIREWTDSTIKRFLKEGRGQGEGPSYKPWLQVQDIASRGRSTRVFSYKTNRIIHLLSDLQLYYYYLLEFDDAVVDIREQFPLLDFHELSIPLDRNLEKKLFNKKTHVPHVFTVSFMITRIDKNNELFHEARVIKASSELEKNATLERLELQRRYFEQKEIDFGIVTDKDINKDLARNIGWFLTAYDIQDYHDLIANFSYLKNDLLEELSASNKSFEQAFSRIESLYQLEKGLMLILFKHLVARKYISINLNRKFDVAQKIEDFNIEVNRTDAEGDFFAVVN